MGFRRTMVFRGLCAARLILLVSGLVTVAIAGTILFTPEAFYAGYGIELEGNATLVNELKAPSGALLVAGLLMFAGIFRSELVVVSLTTAIVVYLSYGLSRLLSMAIDGLPHSRLVGAAGVELLIGGICLLALLHVRRINAH